MTEEEFEAIAARLVRAGRSTRSSGGSSRDCTYRPQVELLELPAGATASRPSSSPGGGIDLIRAFAEEAYGIPREQVIGSSAKLHVRGAGTDARC